MRISNIFCLFIFATISVNAQNNVGIGTPIPDPSAILELKSTSMGILIPRMKSLERTAIASPKDGLLVYDTDSSCFFYFIGNTNSWGNMCNSSAASTQMYWQLTGNGGTTSSTSPIGTAVNNNFIGTTDNNDFVISTNNLERERILASGAISANLAVPNPNIVFSVYGSGYPGAGALGDTAIAGFSTTSNGMGVYGENINGDGEGVVGNANSPFGTGVWGVNTANLTQANQQAIGVFGSTTGTVAPGSFSIAVWGSTSTQPSTGVVGAGNGQSPLLNSSGSGGAFTSDLDGLFASANNVTSGTGILALGNGIDTIPTLSTGSGVVGIGTNYGIAGFANNAINTNGVNTYVGNGAQASAGGYFEVDNTGFPVSWAYVGVLDAMGGVPRKIIGNGTVNTIVKDTNNKLVTLSCPEAPENLFQDLGKGQLQNGKVHIALDPVFSKNIVVNDQHELRVFVQLKENCNGVFVTNQDQNGFDVVELGNGTSNASFTWMVYANRADEVLGDGTVAKYSTERFASAPGPEHKTTAKALQVPVMHTSKAQ